jgi:hypothetical protein
MGHLTLVLGMLLQLGHSSSGFMTKSCIYSSTHRYSLVRATISTTLIKISLTVF